MHLADRWPVTDGADVRDALLAAYSSTDRGYHDRRHLAEVLDRLDELGAVGGVDAVGPAVRVAAWFHDGVYDGAADDEERSAAWAERALPGLVDAGTVAEVARLVRLTATHRPAPGDLAGGALCDADLAILAAGPERYAEYVAGVRRDYAHVPDEAFRAGRAAVLRELLAQPTLFHTPYALDRWEDAARSNLVSELAGLT
jgi:predicted metal-dependent HD superfamily phosphohydrolase